jgi:hypothetical protein
VPLEFLDDLVLHGRPEAWRAGIQRYRDAGITTPVVRLVGVSGLEAVATARSLVGNDMV